MQCDNEAENTEAVRALGGDVPPAALGRLLEEVAKICKEGHRILVRGVGTWVHIFAQKPGPLISLLCVFGQVI